MATIGTYLIGLGFIALALWRVVGIKGFIREDEAWLRDRFGPDAQDGYAAARAHSLWIAALYAAIGAMVLLGACLS